MNDDPVEPGASASRRHLAHVYHVEHVAVEPVASGYCRMNFTTPHSPLFV